MNTCGAYGLSLSASSTVELNVDVFRQELVTVPGSVGFFFPHYYNDHGLPVSYAATVLTDINAERLLDVASIYGISPTKSVSYDGKTHYVFEYEVGISKPDWKIVTEMLEMLYAGTSVDGYFFDADMGFVQTAGSDGAPMENLRGLVNLRGLLDQNGIEREVNKRELDQIEKANALPISEIAMEIGYPIEKTDPFLNISIEYGRCYSLAVNHMSDPIGAKRFFNQNYGMSFDFSEMLEKYRKGGEKVAEGKDFYLDDYGYYFLIEGQKKRQTDFFVNVHFRIKKSEKETVYVVSLVNPSTGDRSVKIEWTNTASANRFADFTQSIGNFHFIGSPKFPSLLHSKIAEFSDAPLVEYLIGYGFHRDKGIVILKNGLFDIEAKVFTQKNEEDGTFVFNWDGKGYCVVDSQGTQLDSIFNGIVPEMRSRELVGMPEVKAFMDSLYRDDSGSLALANTFGAMGYSMFAREEHEERYPIFFIRGTTGSGKTTYMDIVERLWGLRGSSSNFTQTSTFSISIMCSYLRGVPVFFTEFRENSKENIAKSNVVRSVFDNKGQKKGKADQSLVVYNFKSYMMIEGEEMFSDGAVRTRCVQKRFLSNSGIGDEFRSTMRKGIDILDKVLYSYLCRASEKEYRSALKEGIELFKDCSTSPRVRAGLSLMYAGSMAIMPEMRDEWIAILKRSAKFQEDDVQKNSTGMQIVKVIGRFLEQSSAGFDHVYVTENSLVISWNSVEEYVVMKRIMLTLRLEEYKDHLTQMEYPVDWVDVGDKMVYGIVVPKHKIPVEFMSHPSFYQANKTNKKR